MNLESQKAEINKMVWECGYPPNVASTLCVMCGLSQAAPNKFLSICEKCTPRYLCDFNEAIKEAKNRGPNETLLDACTRIKTNHARRVLLAKLKKEETKEMEKKLRKKTDTGKTVETIVAKDGLTISVKNSQTSGPNYVFPCFNRHTIAGGLIEHNTR